MYTHLQQQVLMNCIHIALVLSKHQHWWRRLLQTQQQRLQLVLLLDILYFLNHVKVGST